MGKHQASGWDNGEITEDGYEPGEVKPLDEEPLSDGMGSQVPPTRTNQGQPSRVAYRYLMKKAYHWVDALDDQAAALSEGIETLERKLDDMGRADVDAGIRIKVVSAVANMSQARSDLQRALRMQGSR
jgi:hypothetical protein